MDFLKRNKSSLVINSIYCIDLIVLFCVQAILGKKVIRPTKLDIGLAKRIQSCNSATDYEAILGGTMSTDDFYEGVFCFCDISSIVSPWL